MNPTALNALRRDACEAFNSLWRDGTITRGEAFLWMMEAFGLTAQNAHINKLTPVQLECMIELAPAHKREVIKRREQLKRRKEKQDAKRRKRIRREYEAANRGPNPNRKR